MNDFLDLVPRLDAATEEAAGIPVLLGFDAAVDKLFRVVGERSGLGEAYTPLPDIRSFGGRVNDAAGKSALLEIVPRLEKIGGNGPICALALAAASRRVTYLGPLGTPPAGAFGPLLRAVEAAYSLGEPAVTHALEFDDGKIMLSVLRSYEAVTADALLAAVGRERLVDLLSGARLVAPLNWSCLPHLGDIFGLLLDELLPAARPDPRRLFFFDLADPRKHEPAAIRAALETIARFGAHGRAVLGLNLSEAQQLAAIFGLPEPSEEPDALRRCARSLRETLGLFGVLVHPVRRAACATAAGAWCVEGPYCPKPRLTTGAGDHLNAGFCLGLLLDWSPQDALRLGVLFSGYYVRGGLSPSPGDLKTFIETLAPTHP